MDGEETERKNRFGVQYSRILKAFPSATAGKNELKEQLTRMQNWAEERKEAVKEYKENLRKVKSEYKEKVREINRGKGSKND